MYIHNALIDLQSCEMSTEFAQSMAKEVDVLSRKMHGRSMRGCDLLATSMLTNMQRIYLQNDKLSYK